MNIFKDRYNFLTDIKKITFIFFSLLIYFFIAINFAVANHGGGVPEINLSVSSGSVVNGEPVTIYLEIYGPLKENCKIRYRSEDVDGDTINSGWLKDASDQIITIDTSSIRGSADGDFHGPINKTIQTVPPENLNTLYWAICSSYTSLTSTVETEPAVTIGIAEGTSLPYNPINSRVDRVTVYWDAPNAKKCTNVFKQDDGGASYELTAPVVYSGQGTNQGQLILRGQAANYLVTDSTTFTIRCENNAGTVEKSIHLDVTGRNQPLPEVEIQISSPDQDSGVQIDPLYGKARTSVSFTSQNASWCETKAYYSNGVRYNPSGWTQPYSVARGYSNIYINQTTTFAVTCGRYKENSMQRKDEKTERITIPVYYDISDSNTIINTEPTFNTPRPQVTASITAEPNPATIGVSNYARSKITVNSQNADRCRTTLYKLDTNGNYGIEYSMTYFNTNIRDMIAENGTFEDDLLYLRDETKVVLKCWREVDSNSSDPAVAARAVATDEVVIKVDRPLNYSYTPTVSIYANAFALGAWGMKSNSEDNSLTNDLVYSSSQGNVLVEPSNFTDSTAEISLKYKHPFADEGYLFSGRNYPYDFYLSYCNKKSGKTRYELFIDDVSKGSFDTNPDSPSAKTGNCSRGEDFDLGNFGKDIRIRNGQTIKITCTPSAGGECILKQFLMGTDKFSTNGERSWSVLTPSLSSSDDGWIIVPIMWVTNGVRLNKCATRVKESVPESNSDSGIVLGEWIGSLSKRYGYVRQENKNTSGAFVRYNTAISGPTEFKLICEDVDGNEIGDSVKVTPYSSVVSDTGSVSTGECRVDTAAGGVSVSGYNDGDTVTNPPSNIGPGPGGVCIYLVDLISDIKTQSYLGADGRKGLYSSVISNLRIKNDGDGDLPSGKNITYLSKLTISNPSRFGLISSQIDSIVNRFNDTLASNSNTSILQTILSDVPFGTHQLEVRVNVDDSNSQYPEYDSVGSNADPYSNNIKTVSITIPVPEPPMSINADKTLIQKGKDVTVSWSAVTDYSGMNCTVKGPGIDVSFAANDSSANGDSGNVSQTVTMNSTGEFVLRCVEQTTGESFEKSVKVEVVPGVEET